MHWLEEGVFPSDLNNTNVDLIPRCEDPKSVKDLRPISLCNVVYKRSNRLKIVFLDLIDESQSTFILGPLSKTPC